MPLRSSSSAELAQNSKPLALGKVTSQGPGSFSALLKQSLFPGSAPAFSAGCIKEITVTTSRKANVWEHCPHGLWVSPFILTADPPHPSLICPSLSIHRLEMQLQKGHEACLGSLFSLVLFSGLQECREPPLYAKETETESHTSRGCP